MSESKAVMESIVTEITEEKGDTDVVLAEYTRGLQLDDDFELIENTAPSMIPCQDQNHLDIIRETGTVNIAQHDTNIESKGTAEKCLPDYSEDLTGVLIPTEWEKEVLVDQQYWEQNGAVTQRANGSRIKYPTSQRMTVSDLNKIAKHKTASRDPCDYRFNISTTATLQTFIDKNFVKTYHNVLGKGSSSVVIHAYSHDVYDRHGMAVKIYKLSYDVKNNNAILKRAHKEYEHLRIMRCASVPEISHILKNVIILRFLGKDQEPFPTLSSIPPEYCKGVYQILVEEMDLWYTKFNIVHGKLCTRNILYDTTVFPAYYHCTIPCRPHVIGWGHSVKRDHPRALMKLMRDCHFVTNFFKRRDVPVKTTTDLFKQITGLDKISSKVLSCIDKSDPWREGLLANPNRA